MDVTFEQRNSRSLTEFLLNKSNLQFYWNEKGTSIRLEDGGDILYVTQAAREKLANNDVENLSVSEFRKEGATEWIPVIQVDGFKKGQKSKFPYLENIKNESIYSLLRSGLFNLGYVLLFDLDGTLLDTDIANNRAYKYALLKVTGTNDYPCLENLPRITRKECAKIDGMTTDQLNAIINIKQWYFTNQIKDGYTTLIVTSELLKRQSHYNRCYIITSADRNRAKFLIEYHNLSEYVHGVIYADSINKYQHISEKIGCDAFKIILFENERTAINNAIDNGIVEAHTYLVDNNTLREHTIQKNGYLFHSTQAFYSTYYVGFNKPNNPNFINDIKNQFGTIPIQQLKEAKHKICETLYVGILSILNLLSPKEFVVIAVPRAKADSFYSSNQQLFRQSIGEVVSNIQKLGVNIIDGSCYIVRHTNTKTTHLAKSTIKNEGEMPYPGITKNTCRISEEVIGKDILLIDDVYTKGVNIDEDAIQALYDKGARSVTFYSICKTVHV